MKMSKRMVDFFYISFFFFVNFSMKILTIYSYIGWFDCISNCMSAYDWPKHECKQCIHISFPYWIGHCEYTFLVISIDTLNGNDYKSKAMIDLIEMQIDSALITFFISIDKRRLNSKKFVFFICKKVYMHMRRLSNAWHAILLLTSHDFML